MSRKHALFISGALVFISLVVSAGLAGYRSWQVRHEQHLRQSCLATYETENWKELERIASEWSRWNPDAADAWLFRADVAQKQGDFHRTVEFLGRVPESDPKIVPALVEALELQFGVLNRPFDAVGTCRRVLELDPKLMIVHQRLIFFYAITQQRTKMIEQIRASIEFKSEPRDAYVYLMLSDHLHFTNGYELNTRWLSGTPDSEVLLLARAIQMSETLSKLEDQTVETEAEHRDRAKLMSDYLQLFPHNSALLQYFLRMHEIDWNVDEVERLLTQVPDDVAGDSLFWRYRGWYHAARGEFDKSEKAYRHSAQLFPLDWHTWHGLAGMLRRTKSLAEAERLQKLALQGKELRKQLMQLSDVRAVTDKLLAEIADYALKCGDRQVADALDARLGLVRYGRQNPPNLFTP